MGYNPQNAKEEPALPSDVLFDAVIIAIEDGKVRNYVKGDITKWKNPDSAAINVSMEVLHNDKKHTFDNIFTYDEEAGVTKYSAKSNLGKFKAKYGKLPTVGDQVKSMTNKDGFLRLVLE